MKRTTSKRSHNRHLSLFHYWMVNHVRPLWGRAFLSLSQSAGQTRGNAPVTPLGVKLFILPSFLCSKEIMTSPWNDKRWNGWTRTMYQLDEKDASARQEGCISAKKRMVMRDWSRSLPGLEQVFVGTKAMGSRNFTIAKRSFHYSKKRF